FWIAPNVRGDDGKPCGELFHQSIAKAFFVGGDHTNIHAGKQAWNIILHPQKPHIRFYAEAPCLLYESLSDSAILSCDKENQVRPALAYVGECVDKVAVPFVGDKIGDNGYTDVLGLETQPAARVLPPAPHIIEAAEIETVRDYQDAIDV
ncbi:hypothetical protein, partial [Mesorhizobium sp. M2D.F.Ca.ET.223.01.1.1]|uniref:hypothetical protein n=1 Tax=Mesorhizobium sp. M2D.F.Ca.ET.223.01.1.1 TaxID=2563940 RepID=UPI001FDF30D7